MHAFVELVYLYFLLFITCSFLRDTHCSSGTRTVARMSFMGGFTFVQGGLTLEI